MKTTKIIQFRWISSLLFSLLLIACEGNAYKMRLERGYDDLEARHIDEALANFINVYEKSPDKDLVFEAAKMLADIYAREKKDYKTAIKYLDVLIANSDNFPASLEALKRKAVIQHKDLHMYEQAIISYSRILAYPDLKESEQAELHLNLSKCYLAINKFDQALNEVSGLLDNRQPKERRSEALRQQASILQAQGKYDKAIAIYEELFKTTEDERVKRDLLMTISLSFEQKEDYKAALDTLKRIASRDEMIEGKIKQLERMSVFQGRRLIK